MQMTCVPPYVAPAVAVTLGRASSGTLASGDGEGEVQGDDRGEGRGDDRGEGSGEISLRTGTARTVMCPSKSPALFS